MNLIQKRYQTKEDLDIKRQNVFSRLFSRVIFQNRIVAVVLNTVSKQVVKFERILDEKLNNDI